MMQLLAGPIGRQLIQIGAASVATTGIINESDALTLFGAISSIANIGWMIYARIKAGK
jgi:hypothetical protein